MIIRFEEKAWEDYLHWQATDPKKLARINQLIKAIAREPFKGIGKPEPLRGHWSGFWSRRIDREHRLVYAIQGSYRGSEIWIAQCRFHYN